MPRLAAIFRVPVRAVAACFAGTGLVAFAMQAPSVRASPAFAHPARTAPDGPRASVAGGVVEGRREGDVEVFRGIPYAAPPVGSLRWRAPAPVVPWDGVRQAAAFGADCVQDNVHNPMEPGHTNPESEDCLTVNVWRPARGKGRAARLPVLLWVHGGAFIMGAGSMAAYDGAALAGSGKTGSGRNGQGVIVVSFNYRLGRFGNFTTPALAAEQAARGEPAANFWLMDQIAALRWVRDNIAALGGDPARVTLFGESAGAVSVATLMAVPQARGLFAQAILESGSPRKALVPMAGTAQAAQTVGLAWARSKGVASDDPAALRALPADTVLDAPVTTVSDPVEDGVLLREAPWRTFVEGRMAKVPTIIGANDYEQSLMRWLPGSVPALLLRLGDRAAEGEALYGASGEGRDAALARMWGDAVMVEPARATARVMAKSGAPTWLYRFSYVPEALRATRPGVGHADEIEFVFDTPSQASRVHWSAADAAMARAVSARWVAFARTGRPDGAGAPVWPRLAPGHDVLLDFAAQGPTIREGVDAARLDFLHDALENGSRHSRSAP